MQRYCAAASNDLPRVQRFSGSFLALSTISLANAPQPQFVPVGCSFGNHTTEPLDTASVPSISPFSGSGRAASVVTFAMRARSREELRDGRLALRH